MRWIIVIGAASFLASCDAYKASENIVNGAGQTVTDLKPAGSPEAITVVTAKSVPEYYKDLQHCRSVVAASMGPPGASDDLEAVKRAWKEHPHAKQISVTYINNDRTIQRREAVKKCLLRSGYVVVK